MNVATRVRADAAAVRHEAGIGYDLATGYARGRRMARAGRPIAHLEYWMERAEADPYAHAVCDGYFDNL